MPIDQNYANAWLSGGGANQGMNQGSNQWMSYPTMNNPLQQSNFQAGPFNPFTSAGSTTATGESYKLRGGYQTIPTINPEFTRQFMQYLQSQMGKGVGQFTGQLSADPNELLQSLFSFISGGPSSIPGSPELAEIARTGGPIDVLPAWQSMIQSQQQNIGQREADLREQFAFAGNLQGSPFGTAMGNFQSQTALDQNAMLSQMTQQALESAQGRKLGAGAFLQGQAFDLGNVLQGLDQSSLDRLYQEFQRTSPENNPLLGLISQFSGATPGIYKRGSWTEAFNNFLQGLGSVASGQKQF